MKMLTAVEFKPHVADVMKKMGAPYNVVCLETLAGLFEPAIDSGIGRVYAQDDGFLCALFIVDPITGDKTAVEQLWYQVPHRGKNGLALLRAFESDARKLGCKRILCGCILHRNRLGELYQRLGYSILSETYSKEIEA